MSLTIGSLFSGIGGLELGLEWAGLGPVKWQVEKDDYCRRVLEKHWPGAQRYDDIKEVEDLPHVDLICGGFPCQDISSAGKGAGLAGERSGLWSEYARIVNSVRPQWVVVENVASGAKRWVDAVTSELGQLRYETLPITLSAQDVGASHLRRRIFVIAYSDSEQLREQPRRSRRKSGEGAPQPTIHSGWPTEPGMGRASDGVPHRMDRLRALGNAVVPQCSEVIGHVIQELR